jgi:2-oxoglutarate ferredoxin oxidoreductase subunit beta
MRLEVIDAQARLGEVLRHDEKNPTLAQLLLSMQGPEFPVALGVVYRDPRPSFEASFYKAHPTGLKRTASVADALRQTNTWWVK